MKIISIIKNDLTNTTTTDLAVYLKDNYPHGGEPPTPPRNSVNIAHTKSGLPVLQIEFWRNERFQKYFWHGEWIYFNADEDTDYSKGGNQWLKHLEVYNSF